MNLKWAATLIIVVGALAVWRGVALKPHAGRAATGSSTRTPLDARAAALTTEVARLHGRLEPGQPPRLGRNLFRFVTPAAVPRHVPISLPVSMVAAASPLPPALKLIGVAEDTASGGLVRTAIISAPDQVYVVKEGERVTPRYLVSRVSADVVELKDLDDAGDPASFRRLALK
jgi:hypothetical protein